MAEEPRARRTAAGSAWEHREIRLGFGDDAGERRARFKSLQVACDALVASGDGMHQVAVVERGRGGAVGHAEGFARGPAAARQRAFENAVRLFELGVRLLDA